MLCLLSSHLQPFYLDVTMSFLNKSNSSDPAAQDVQLPPGPTDSVSSLCFSPTADYLAVSSWDNNVRVYEVGANIAGRAAFDHGAPVLDTCWTQDGRVLISAGVDGSAKAHDLEKQSSQQVAAHDAGIRCVRWAESVNMLVTGSWDKTIRVCSVCLMH